MLRKQYCRAEPDLAEFQVGSGCRLGRLRLPSTMSDPRNVAHDKTVISEKKHHGEDPAAHAKADVVQPGKKPAQAKHEEHEDPATARKHAAEEAKAEVQETVKAHDEHDKAQHS